MDKVLGDINKAELKHTETVDKSAPVIDKDVSVKKCDRKEMLAGVETQKDNLKHTETVDKSAPVIDKDAKVGQSQRPALLAEIQKKGQ